jgi:hypothetical protein
MLPKAIDPKLWGASAWYILHRLSFGFRNANHARDFYMSLMFLLPCPKCRMSFTEHVKKHPFPTKHQNIPEWCVHLHNMVNISVGKEVVSDIKLKDIQLRYAHTNEDEWTFISALVDSHPGKRFISEEHVNALRVFLSEWVKSWNGVPAPSQEILQSKTLLKQWLHKNDPSKMMRKFGVCATNTCELRVGGLAANQLVQR